MTIPARISEYECSTYNLSIEYVWGTLRRLSGPRPRLLPHFQVLGNKRNFSRGYLSEPIMLTRSGVIGTCYIRSIYSHTQTVKVAENADITNSSSLGRRKKSGHKTANLNKSRDIFGVKLDSAVGRGEGGGLMGGGHAHLSSLSFRLLTRLKPTYERVVRREKMRALRAEGGQRTNTRKLWGRLGCFWKYSASVSNLLIFTKYTGLSFWLLCSPFRRTSPASWGEKWNTEGTTIRY